MIALLAAAALGGPASLPSDPDGLAAAEREALRQIEGCRAAGRACGATAEELAEAFVVRAVTAAVLRGELDGDAVASALRLDPDATAGWEHLLPAPDGHAPEPWVPGWIDPPPPTLAEAVTSRTSPARETARAPLRLREEDPVLLRLAASGEAWRRAGTSVGVQAQLPLSAGWSAWTELGIGALANELHGAGLPERLDVGSGWLHLGLGPRWTASGGADLHLVGVIGLSSVGLLGAPAGVEAQALPLGIGGLQLGVVAVHPLQGALALRWSAFAGPHRSDLYVVGDDDDFVELYAVTASRTSTALAADVGLRWRPGGGALGVDVGPTLGLGDRGDRHLAVGVASALVWRSGADAGDQSASSSTSQ